MNATTVNFPVFRAIKLQHPLRTDASNRGTSPAEAGGGATGFGAPRPVIRITGGCHDLFPEKLVDTTTLFSE